MKITLFIYTFLLWHSYANSQNRKISQDQPNILLIIADDLTFSDIEPYGSTQVHTPNISRLAQEGVSFDNMFTATAMCAPTRQQLMTGLFPVRNGAYPNHSEVYKGTRSVAHHLQGLGYKTGLIGKRHYGSEKSFPFDYLGGRDSDNGKGQDINLEVAENYITESKDKPYFLIVASNQPHSPWTRGDASAYPPSEIELPPNFEDTEITRKQMSRYFAEITYLDSLVGVCLDIVERSGQKDNTVVIFTTEQGASLPFGKWTCYDQGLHAGFIVRWPGKIKAASRVKALTQYVDVVPTLVDIAGGAPQEVNTGNKDALGATGFDGRSFKELLIGKDRPFRQYVFGVQTTKGIINGSDAYGIRSSRDDRYLYIHNLNSENKFSNVLVKGLIFKQWKAEGTKGRAAIYETRPSEELYDIQNDPYQIVNLAANSSFNNIKSGLKSALTIFMAQQRDLGIETEMTATQRQPKSRKK